MSKIVEPLGKYVVDYTNKLSGCIDTNASHNYDKSILLEYNDIFDGWDSWAAYPYYRLRGPRVTEDQAFEIISKLDMVLDEMYGIKTNKVIISTNHIKGISDLSINWFLDNWTLQGWRRPDEIIGINGITDRYPELDKILNQLYTLIKHFPFINFVWATTNWDEIPPECWNEDDFNSKQAYEEDCVDFTDNIDILFYVHDRKIEIIQGELAKQKYEEYNTLYGSNEKEFIRHYYMTGHTLSDKYDKSIVNRKYLEKCLSTYGMSINNIKFLGNLLI